MMTCLPPRPELLLAFLSFASGCATGAYVHRFEESATAPGVTPGSYRVPARSPQGEVRVATLGIATIAPRSRDDDSRTHAVHVRLSVDHWEGAPWQVDTRHQIASMIGRGQSRPAFAASSVGQPPVVTIQPGASVRIDLYYPLPKVMQTVTYIPRLEVAWELSSPEGPVQEQTVFTDLRDERPAPTDLYAWDRGWWGPSWFDPLWVEETFIGAPILQTPPTEQQSVVDLTPPQSVR
jgi:hypothetical protein